MTQAVKSLPAMQETWVRSLRCEDPLEKEMATHSSTLAWKIPRIEEPGGLQSMGSQRVGHNWAVSLFIKARPQSRDDQERFVSQMEKTRRGWQGVRPGATSAEPACAHRQSIWPCGLSCEPWLKNSKNASLPTGHHLQSDITEAHWTISPQTKDTWL